MSSLNPRNLIILFVVFGAAVVGCDFLMIDGPDGTLLMTLTLFTMLAQGTVAVVAVAESTKGVWFIPLKRDLLSFYPLTFFMAFLFLAIGMRMDMYGWAETHPIGWLEPRFFVIRNFAIMLITAWSAHLFAGSVMRHDASRHRRAIVYIVLWVISISMVAYDWLMTLEYPFINTLFGPFYFIQSLLLGLFTTAFVILFRTRAGEEGLKGPLWDVGKLMFAFSFMWGGFLFTQYLVIWYGNIPEEVAYILKRVDPSPYWGLSRVLLASMFLIPFLVLLSRKIKTSPMGIVTIACISMIGMIVEQVIVIRPVVPINAVASAIQMALMLILVVLVYRTRNSFMPQQVEESAGTRAHRGEPDEIATAPHK
jgi:hypothetical protein